MSRKEMISTRVDAATKRDLQRLADADLRSVSGQIAVAINEHIKANREKLTAVRARPASQ